MPTIRMKTDLQILELYKSTLNNVEHHPLLAKTLAEFGYGPLIITKGKQLVAETMLAFDFNRFEDSETLAAKHAFEAQYEKLSEVFFTHRQKALVVFRKKPLVLQQLGILQPEPMTYAKWTGYIRKFYHEVLSDASVFLKIEKMSFSAQEVSMALNKLSEVEIARSRYLSRLGESVESTKAKDKAFKQLDDWMSDFYAVAQIAIEDNPKMLESIKALVRRS